MTITDFSDEYTDTYITITDTLVSSSLFQGSVALSGSTASLNMMVIAFTTMFYKIYNIYVLTDTKLKLDFINSHSY